MPKIHSVDMPTKKNSSLDKLRQAKRRDRALRRKLEKAETQARRSAKQAKMLAAARLSFPFDEPVDRSTKGEK